MISASKQLLRAVAAADAASAAVAVAWETVHGLRSPRSNLATRLAGRRRRRPSAATLRRLAPRCVRSA